MRKIPKEHYTFWCRSQDGTGRTIDNGSFTYVFPLLTSLPKNVKYFDMALYICINPAPYIVVQSMYVSTRFDCGSKVYNSRGNNGAIMSAAMLPTGVGAYSGSKTQLNNFNTRYNFTIERPSGNSVTFTPMNVGSVNTPLAMQPFMIYITLTPIYDENFEPPAPMINPFNNFDK